MLDGLYEKVGGSGSVAAIIISIALMLFCGFLATRLTKLLKLPNVTAYILTGIVIGPYCLDFIPANVISGMDFISDIALAFIAFGVGEFFRLSAMKKNGKKVALITLFEALAASLAVFILTFFILKLGLAFSVILAALASATAPASTMMTIRQTNAKGDFVDTLLSVVALDDVVSLVAFSVAVSLATASLGGQLTAGDILLPVALNIAMIALGCLCGLLLKFLMAKRSTDNRLIVSVALLFCVCGVGAAVNVSPLLGCMAMGTVYINLTDDEKLFKQLNYFSPPILLLFFVHSGLGFRIDALFGGGSMLGVPLLAVGVLYFFVRILGKYLGAFLGCLVTKKPKTTRNYLGLALIPQAGVAIGLAALGSRILGGEAGYMLETVILSSSILYELIGPAAAKCSLYLSKSYGAETAAVPTEEEEKTAKVNDLTAKLLEIEKELEKHRYARSEEEAAFTEAAEEEIGVSEYMRKYKGSGGRR